MAKVTSKLQVTLPKAVAARYDIEPGDVIRVVPPRKKPILDMVTRLELFDEATARQRKRERATRPAAAASRGWTREELYERGHSR